MTFSPRSIEAACEAFTSTNNLLGKQLQAALTAALAVDGLALVPKEPTLEQHIAAMEFALAHMEAHGVTSLSPFEDYPPLRETTAGMYRAMIAAASDDPAPALQGWQPIESAPINRAILIKTNAPDYYGNSGIYEAMLVDMGSGRRWATFGHGVGRDLGCDWEPTHWQPLPQPPAASNREERR